MKLTFRFVFPLLVLVALIAYATVPAVEYVTSRWFLRDMEVRSKIIGDALQESIAPLLSAEWNLETKRRVAEILGKMTENNRVLAMGYCSPANVLELRTPLFPPELRCEEVVGSPPHTLVVKRFDGTDLHATKAPLVQPGGAADGSVAGHTGMLVVVHDNAFAMARTNDTKKALFLMFLAIGMLTSLAALLIARWSLKGWVRSLRSLLTGAQVPEKPDITDKEFLPFVHDLRSLIRDLESNRALRDELHISWTPETLREILAEELLGGEVIVVSNRQPYIHMKDGGQVRAVFPASGLVTAIEPIVRACSGVWIAHGNGTADREVVDRHDRVKVPPGKDEYEIHRIWLSEAEEKGYYYGFSNEGLWPLCHIAHTRPIFRQSDWEHYVAINQRFAEAVIRDARCDDPVVLVQDYHFALVPRMIRNELPNATIITFWHIPWPNPEAFGICPWREEILDGLLGSSIMGFHTRFHRNNFVETVDRFLESRIDRELSSISYGGGTTLIRSYPISIEWPPQQLAGVPATQECGARIRRQNGIADDVRLGIGVDRLDYTKGILERFRAVERLFELHPEWIGKFTFIQIAAPSRSSIPAYRDFDQEVRRMAAAINERFGSGSYLPVLLKVQHHEPELVYEYMRAASLCFVSSLHDGMNLVAKEFIATRNDEQGALILSMFAGASRELTEALIVNPYDIEQCAAALHSALGMSPREQRERMHAMRSLVKEFNIYRWAGRMLLDAASLRRKSHFSKRFSPRRASVVQQEMEPRDLWCAYAPNPGVR